MNSIIRIYDNRVFLPMNGWQSLEAEKDQITYNYIGVRWSNNPGWGVIEIAEIRNGDLVSAIRSPGKRYHGNDIRIIKMNISYSFGYEIYGNYDIRNILKIKDGRYGYKISGYHSVDEGYVSIQSGIIQSIEPAQQVDSAEASTIAVPPSDPSGSPR